MNSKGIGFIELYSRMQSIPFVLTNWKDCSFREVHRGEIEASSPIASDHRGTESLATCPRSLR
jgi:hypothetical protein